MLLSFILTSSSDLTVVRDTKLQQKLTKPGEKKDVRAAVMLNWQPPLHANGEVAEYLIYYATDLRTPDRQWMIASTNGESIFIFNMPMQKSTLQECI